MSRNCCDLLSKEVGERELNKEMGLLEGGGGSLKEGGRGLNRAFYGIYLLPILTNAGGESIRTRNKNMQPVPSEGNVCITSHGWLGLRFLLVKKSAYLL